MSCSCWQIQEFEGKRMPADIHNVQIIGMWCGTGPPSPPRSCLYIGARVLWLLDPLVTA
jgi:hypothetical protein